MAASSKITAAFTAEAKGMQKGISKVIGSLNKVTKTSQKTGKAFASMSRGINFLVFDKVAGYAARAGRAFITLASNALKTVDAIGKLSKSTGYPPKVYRRLVWPPLTQALTRLPCQVPLVVCPND